MTGRTRAWVLAASTGAALLMAISVACGGKSSSTTTSSTTLATITLTPTSTSVNVNQSVTFVASAVDSAGNQVTSLTYAWASATPTVAVVNASGLALGLTPGTSQITASADNVTSAPATITVLPPVASVTVTPPSATISVGGTQQFKATAFDAKGNAISAEVITWSLTNAGVATINSSGLVTGVSPGTVSVFATAGGITSPAVTLTVK